MFSCTYLIQSWAERQEMSHRSGLGPHRDERISLSLIAGRFFRVFDSTRLPHLFLFSPKRSLKTQPAVRRELTGCYCALYLNLYFLLASRFSSLDKCFLHLESLAQTMPCPPQDIASWSVFATTDGTQVSTGFGPPGLDWRLWWSEGGPTATVFPRTPARGASPPVSPSSGQPQPSNLADRSQKSGY